MCREENPVPMFMESVSRSASGESMRSSVAARRFTKETGNSDDAIGDSDASVDIVMTSR